MAKPGEVEAITGTVPSKGWGSVPHLIIEPSWTDPKSGAVYVHRDLEMATPAWAVEEHIGPPRAAEVFGDIESWTQFVSTYGAEEYTLLTWSARGLRAILDYHEAVVSAGRCQFTATMPFVKSPEWLAWERLADGRPKSQRELVEALEDLAEDVVSPSAADLMQMLRSLRANVKTEASAELRADGSTSVAWGRDKSIATGNGEMAIPATIQIAIPVLKGQADRWQVTVRLRVAVSDDAKLGFHLSLTNAERVLEATYASLVQQAREALGESFHLLRAGD